jgi:hypothetical protein
MAGLEETSVKERTAKSSVTLEVPAFSPFPDFTLCDGETEARAA